MGCPPACALATHRYKTTLTSACRAGWWAQEKRRLSATACDDRDCRGRVTCVFTLLIPSVDGIPDDCCDYCANTVLV